MIPNLPIIYEPCAVSFARGFAGLSGREITPEFSVSSLSIAAPILFARGASEILVPAPRVEKSNPRLSLVDVPSERHHRVRLIDRTGRILSKVQKYLKPLDAGQVFEWYELPHQRWESVYQAFEDFAYQVALSREYGALIANSGPQRVWSDGYSGAILHSIESRYRYLELSALAIGCRPFEVEFPSVDATVSVEIQDRLWNAIDSADFGELLKTSRRAAYLRRPKMAYRMMQAQYKPIMKKFDLKRVFRMASRAISSGAGVSIPDELLSSPDASDDEGSPGVSFLNVENLERRLLPTLLTARKQSLGLDSEPGMFGVIVRGHEAHFMSVESMFSPDPVYSPAAPQRWNCAETIQEQRRARKKFSQKVRLIQEDPMSTPDPLDGSVRII